MTITYLKRAIRLLAGYYTLTNESIEEVSEKWQQNEKVRDKIVHAYYTWDEIAPYREYIWTREHSRRSEKEWDNLKESLTLGWDEHNPINIIVYKDGHIKVGEGNHRLGVVEELAEENPKDYQFLVEQIPVNFLFYQGYGIEGEVNPPW